MQNKQRKRPQRRVTSDKQESITAAQSEKRDKEPECVSAVSAAGAYPPGHGSVESLQYPPPEFVAEMARGEPNVRLIADYTEAIEILRDEKRFTFREIAQWLTDKFGIQADHNAVYRAYTKGMPEPDAIEAGLQDEEDERDAAGA